MDPMNLAELVEPAHARGDVKLIRAREELRAALAPIRREGSSIGLVPTMGCLHDGHLSLLRAARAECDIVVMSLFVNPTQFGAGEDLDRYPRDEERDLRLAAEAGVDIVWAPPVEEVYPESFSTHVEVEGLTRMNSGSLLTAVEFVHLEGRDRRRLALGQVERLAAFAQAQFR